MALHTTTNLCKCGHAKSQHPNAGYSCKCTGYKRAVYGTTGGVTTGTGVHLSVTPVTGT